MASGSQAKAAGAPRMREFVRMFDLEETDNVIEISGTRGNWESMPIRPNILLVK